MGKDIKTQYTRFKNKEQGRRGYLRWKDENEAVITPKEYGMFLQRKWTKK